MFPAICKLISPSYNQTVVHNGINTINMLLLTNTEIVKESMNEYFLVLLQIGSQVFQ